MQRKHRRQMSHREIAHAEKLVHGINEWNFAVDHVMDRMAQKNIAKQDLVDTVRLGEVIEVNSRGRVVLRLRTKFSSKMRPGTCVVVSIADRVLITAWYNDPRDQHATLDLSEYTWAVNTIEYLGGLQ